MPVFTIDFVDRLTGSTLIKELNDLLLTRDLRPVIKEDEE
jgi:hypothetical protein